MFSAAFKTDISDGLIAYSIREKGNISPANTRRAVILIIRCTKTKIQAIPIPLPAWFPIWHGFIAQEEK